VCKTCHSQWQHWSLDSSLKSSLADDIFHQTFSSATWCLMKTQRKFDSKWYVLKNTTSFINMSSSFWRRFFDKIWDSGGSEEREINTRAVIIISGIEHKSDWVNIIFNLFFFQMVGCFQLLDTCIIGVTIITYLHEKWWLVRALILIIWNFLFEYRKGCEAVNKKTRHQIFVSSFFFFDYFLEIFAKWFYILIFFFHRWIKWNYNIP
jgi:hypothetical protein